MALASKIAADERNHCGKKVVSKDARNSAKIEATAARVCGIVGSSLPQGRIQTHSHHPSREILVCHQKEHERGVFGALTATYTI